MFPGVKILVVLIRINQKIYVMRSIYDIFSKKLKPSSCFMWNIIHYIIAPFTCICTFSPRQFLNLPSWNSIAVCSSSLFVWIGFLCSSLLPTHYIHTYTSHSDKCCVNNWIYLSAIINRSIFLTCLDVLFHTLLSFQSYHIRFRVSVFSTFCVYCFCMGLRR